MRASDKAWIGLAAGVAVWDVFCPPEETLTHAAHRYMSAHRTLTAAVVCYMAGHLMHTWPEQVDPLHHIP